MTKYSKQDVLKMICDENIKLLHFLFNGISHCFTKMAVMPFTFVDAFCSECKVIGIHHMEKELLLPDCDTFVIFPLHLQNGQAVHFQSEMYKPETTPFTGDGNYIGKKQLCRNWIYS